LYGPQKQDRISHITQLFQYHMTRSVGVAWKIVKLIHRFSLSSCLHDARITMRELGDPALGFNA
jgi:hypothetical protein